MTTREITPERCEKQFAGFLAWVREGKGLNQGELAKRIGKSRSVVSFFESARRTLKPEEFPAWADALGVDAQDIEALSYLSYGYRRWEDEWTFWLDIEEGEDNPQEVNMGMTDLLEELLNRMAGKKICQLTDDRYAHELGELELLLPRSQGPRPIFRLHKPKQPFLGDPNSSSEVRIQGTREDLEALLANCTSDQIALTTAFIRGLQAQARSRLRVRTNTTEFK